MNQSAAKTIDSQLELPEPAACSNAPDVQGQPEELNIEVLGLVGGGMAFADAPGKGW